jgi:hypothetical protein
MTRSWTKNCSALIDSAEVDESLPSDAGGELASLERLLDGVCDKHHDTDLPLNIYKIIRMRYRRPVPIPFLHPIRSLATACKFISSLVCLMFTPFVALLLATVEGAAAYSSPELSEKAILDFDEAMKQAVSTAFDTQLCLQDQKTQSKPFIQVRIRK